MCMSGKLFPFRKIEIRRRLRRRGVSRHPPRNSKPVQEIGFARTRHSCPIWAHNTPAHIPAQRAHIPDWGLRVVPHFLTYFFPLFFVIVMTFRLLIVLTSHAHYFFSAHWRVSLTHFSYARPFDSHCTSRYGDLSKIRQHSYNIYGIVGIRMRKICSINISVIPRI